MLDKIKIRKAGDPILQQSAVAVDDFNSNALQKLIDNMLTVMHEYNGAGLAAPQIGVAKRVIVYGIEQNPRYPDIAKIPDTVLINPGVVWLSSKTADYYEGCLSFPDLRGLVTRPVKAVITANLPDGKKIEREVQDFEARVILHELDHLDGILFPSRMTDLSKLRYVES